MSFGVGTFDHKPQPSNAAAAAKQRKRAIHTYTDFLVLFSHRVLISFPFNLARQCFDNRLVLNTNHVNGISELAAALRFDLAPAKQGHSFQYMLCLCTRTEQYDGRTGGCGVRGGGMRVLPKQGLFLGL